MKFHLRFLECCWVYRRYETDNALQCINKIELLKQRLIKYFNFMVGGVSAIFLNIVNVYVTQTLQVDFKNKAKSSAMLKLW